MTCIWLELDCSALGISGNDREIDRTLTLVDASSLEDLFLINCPEIRFPSSISRFHHLMIKTSSIVEWDTSLDELGSIQLYDVRLAANLSGLIHIAPRVQWIHLVNTEASELLSTVGDSWRNVQLFDCLNCSLDQFPPVLHDMPELKTTALASNNFSQIPDNWPIPRTQLQAIWLDFNPFLNELPDAIWRQVVTCAIF